MCLTLLSTLFLANTTSAVVLPVADDSFINLNQPDGNKGTDLEVQVKDTTNARQGFVKFDLSTLPALTAPTDVESAQLRLWVKDLNNAGGDVEFYLVNGAWDEDSLTPNTAPPIAATPLATMTLTGPYRVVRHGRYHARGAGLAG